MENKNKYVFESEAIDQISAAFVKAQADYKPITKDTSAGRMYKYATLDQILTTIEPILNKHGIAFEQFPVTDLVYNKKLLYTRLVHESGQFRQSYIELPAITAGNNRNEHQEFGTALTYYRKYTAFCVLGIHPENEDTDGNPVVEKLLSSEQLENMLTALEGKVLLKEEILTKCQVNRLSEIPEKHYSPIMSMIQKRAVVV